MILLSKSRPPRTHVPAVLIVATGAFLSRHFRTIWRSVEGASRPSLARACWGRVTRPCEILNHERVRKWGQINYTSPLTRRGPGSCSLTSVSNCVDARRRSKRLWWVGATVGVKCQNLRTRYGSTGDVGSGVGRLDEHEPSAGEY